MRIVKTAPEAFRMTLALAEARIFINCTSETIRRISSREYQTRMGATLSDIKGMIDALESALK